MISTTPPKSRTRAAKSDVPPGLSPVGFSSQTRTENKWSAGPTSTRAVLSNFCAIKLYQKPASTPHLALITDTMAAGRVYKTATWYLSKVASRAG